MAHFFQRGLIGAAAGLVAGITLVGGAEGLDRRNQLINLPLYQVYFATAAGCSVGFIYALLDSVCHLCETPTRKPPFL